MAQQITIAKINNPTTTTKPIPHPKIGTSRRPIGNKHILMRKTMTMSVNSSPNFFSIIIS
jgi:hypothetical protein